MRLQWHAWVLGMAAVMPWLKAENATSPGAIEAASPVTVFPEVLRFAAARGIATSGIDSSPGSTGAVPGDSVTALVTLLEPNHRKQWLVQLTTGALTNAERARIKPEAATVALADGSSYTFRAARSAALEISTHGPFELGKKPRPGERHARTLISPDYLSLGLDSFCRAVLRLSGSKSSRGLLSYTENERRAMAGAVPSLSAFAEGIRSTPGFNEVLFEISKKPSVLSILKNHGIAPGVRLGQGIVAVAPSVLSWPGQPVYELPLDLTLNAQPALHLTVMATSPARPLLATAGIVRIIVASSGTSPKRLEIQVIAAHLAGR